MKLRTAAYAASLLAVLPALAGAQDAPSAATLDTIIVTGTKTGIFGAKSGIPIERMPQAIQVIDAADLVDRGARSVDDAMRAVPSATVAGSRISRSPSFSLRIRGFMADQMRNGMRQRYYEDVDGSSLSNVARIEVLKGPSAVLYGESAIGGIVSIITKQPTAAFAGSVALTGGSFDQRMVTVDVGGPISDTFGIRVTGEIERSGTFVDHQDLDRDNVGLALSWRPTDWVSAHLVAEHVRRTTRNNPGLPVVGTVVGNGVARVDRSTFLGEPAFSVLEADAPLLQAWADFRLSSNWTLTPRLQYSEFNNLGQQSVLLAPVPGQPTRIQREGRYAGENDRFHVAQLDLAGSTRAFGLQHELLLGIEASDEKVAFRQRSVVPCGMGAIDALAPVYGCGPPTPAFGFLSVNKVRGVAVYVQDQVALTDAWHVIGGLRRSQAKTDSAFTAEFFGTQAAADLSNTTWQLGTTYALRQGVSLFGGYNTGYDLEWVLGARRRDGTPFAPETSDQAEIGMRIARDTLHASVSAFRIRRNDVATPDPLDAGFQVQEGQLRVQGVELEGQWSPLPGWWLQGGYAYLDGQVTRSTNRALVGAPLAETPRSSATVWSRVTLGRFEMRAGGNHVGSRRMVNGGSVVLPAYTIFNLGIGTDIGAFQLDATLGNLFDRTYYYSDNGSVYSVGGENFVYPGEPRNLSLRVAYNFGASRSAK